MIISRLWTKQSKFLSEKEDIMPDSTEKQDKVEQLLNDLRWSHFFLFLLSKDDGGVIAVRKEKDGKLVCPLTEMSDLQAVYGGIKAAFRKDLDLLKLFQNLVHQAIDELKKEKLLTPQDGKNGEA